MKSKLIAIPALLFALLSSNSWAALVTFQDGDAFTLNSGDTIAIDGELSVADPTFTFGVIVDPGVIVDFTVTAPDEFDLLAKVTSAPDFGGSTFINPSIFGLVYAGTSFTFPMDGNYHAGQTNWLSISVDGNQTALDWLAANGPLPVGAAPSSVPVPAAVWLFGSGLLGLVGVARRKKAV